MILYNNENKDKYENNIISTKIIISFICISLVVRKMVIGPYFDIWTHTHTHICDFFIYDHVCLVLNSYVKYRGMLCSLVGRSNGHSR